MKSFYSNGKLLLSGEYAVLDGAKAWAIPTKFGQSLYVTEKDSSYIDWKSYDNEGKVWFEASIDSKSLEIVSSSDDKTSTTLTKILSEAQNFNPYFLKGSGGQNIETKLDFPRNWGLGTSSTLINNIANWAEVDAYHLLKSSFGGSGYDIACAKHDRPILFQLNNGIPSVQELTFDIPFTHALYFVYLNQKKNSREAISAYRKLDMDKTDFIQGISSISENMSTSNTLQEFEDLIEKHEREISKTLGLDTVKSKLFEDFPGSIKSLGAWGGDFILATGTDSTPRYFKKKGFTTVIPFDDMIF